MRIQIFAGLLLVSAGLIKLVLVAAVARHRRWAYPVAVVVFGGFAVYQSIGSQSGRRRFSGW